VKTCSKCGETKPIDEFVKNGNICLICHRQFQKEYRLKNPDKIKEWHRKYRHKNKDKINEQGKKYYLKNKNKINERERERYLKDKDQINERHKEYRLKNIDKLNEYSKEYYLENKDKIREYYLKNKEKIKKQKRESYLKNHEKRKERMKEYYLKNKKIIIEHHGEYEKNRRKTDPKFRLVSNIRGAISRSLHGSKNGRHWEDLVGYTLNDLKAHLEKQFTDGMNWANYGEWHIDHIIPLSRWNFTKPEHVAFKKCWALDNLQPLWAEENLSKNARLECDFQGYMALG